MFPQILTPISRQDLFNINPGAWSPPSATYPLGQTKYGRDVLALLAYGVLPLMQVCIPPVLTGMVLGVVFGYLAKVHWGVKDLIVGIMVILLIPNLISVLIFSTIMVGYISVMMNFMVMSVTTGITLVVSNGSYSPMLTAKKLIIYFPLFMAFNLLLFGALGFLGLSDPSLINLGYLVAEARLYLFDAPWASLWPGIALYVLVVGFLLLHHGLKEPIPITERILIARRIKTKNEKIIENE
jgi:ABC-type dipeptide/oligopeptide/nickel transport system permease subunit